jgi:hypothetical protein
MTMGGNSAWTCQGPGIGGAAGVSGIALVEELSAGMLGAGVSAGAFVEGVSMLGCMINPGVGRFAVGVDGAAVAAAAVGSGMAEMTVTFFTGTWSQISMTALKFA